MAIEINKASQATPTSSEQTPNQNAKHSQAAKMTEAAGKAVNLPAKERRGENFGPHYTPDTEEFANSSKEEPAANAEEKDIAVTQDKPNVHDDFMKYLHKDHDR